MPTQWQGPRNWFQLYYVCTDYGSFPSIHASFCRAVVEEAFAPLLVLTTVISEQKLAASLEEQLHDTQAALSAAQTLLSEKEAMSKKLKEAAKLYGANGHPTDPTQSTEKDASRSLRQVSSPARR